MEEVLHPAQASEEVWAAAVTVTVGDKNPDDDDVAEAPLNERKSDPNDWDINPDAPAAERERIRELVVRDLLLCPAKGVGLSNAPPMEIRLRPGAEINNRNYRLRPEQELEAMKLAENMFEGGVLRRSVSRFNSPVVLARKADGTWRFCVDYRHVNSATERDAYQLPRPNDLIARLGGSKIFSVLDLASAFWQVRLAEEAKQYTAFSVLSGHYEFEVVPMGLMNSPPWMQRAIEEALHDVLYRGALAYIDDVIVYASSWDEHYERLKKVFECLREYGFRTRRDKCRFGYKSIKFLGHIVSEDGVRMSDRNLSKIRNAVVPKDTKELESALALFSYYRRFIPRYSDLVRPLQVKLTAAQQHLRADGKDGRRAHGKLELSPEDIEQYEEIKRRLCAPDNLLMLPDWEKDFVVEADASDYHGHVTLSQYEKGSKKLRPVEFYSFLLPKELWKGPTYARELHAFVEGVRHFSDYLMVTQSFEGRIDQQSLQHLHDQAMISAQYARKAGVISPFRVKWVYQKSADHRHIDCFTRAPFAVDMVSLLADPTKAAELLQGEEIANVMCLRCLEMGKPVNKCPLPMDHVEHRSADGKAGMAFVAGLRPCFFVKRDEGSAENVQQAVAGVAQREAAPAAVEQSEQCVALRASAQGVADVVPLAAAVSATSQGARGQLHGLTREEVKQLQEKDEYFGPIVQFLRQRNRDRAQEGDAALQELAEYYLLSEDGLLYHVGMLGRRARRRAVQEASLPLAVPAAMREQVLKVYHGDATAGHLGFRKALPRLLEDCYWPGIVKDLLDFEGKCASCAHHKLPRRGKVGELHSISAERPFERIAMDILGPLPRTRRGNAYILVVEDYLSRYVIIRPLRTQTASEVARVLVREVFLNRAPSEILLSDRGGSFMADVMMEIYKYFGVLKVNTSAYHPQTDGMVERFNHTLAAMLAHYVSDGADDWDEYLVAVQFAYNTSQHATTGVSPHEAMHGWVARLPAFASLGIPLPPTSASQWLARLKNRMEELHKFIVKRDADQKAKVKDRYDGKSDTKVEFEAGQKVFKKNEHLSSKFDEKLLGPFVVLQARPETDNYKIRHVGDVKGRGQWVHVSKLFPQRPQYDAHEEDLQEEDAEDADEAEWRPADADDDKAAGGPAPSSSPSPTPVERAVSVQQQQEAPVREERRLVELASRVEPTVLTQGLDQLLVEIVKFKEDSVVPSGMRAAVWSLVDDNLLNDKKASAKYRGQLREARTYGQLLALLRSWRSALDDPTSELQGRVARREAVLSKRTG